MAKRIWTDQELVDAVSSSKTYKEVMYKLGLNGSHGGNSRHIIKKHINRLNLDTTHFDLTGRVGVARGHKRRKWLEQYLIKDAPQYPTSRMKQYLLDFGLLNNVCSVCGQGPVWNNRSLTLQLDHINGNHHDNRIENLRIVCPNCHTQTDNYVGRNKALRKNARVR